MGWRPPVILGFFLFTTLLLAPALAQDPGGYTCNQIVYEVLLDGSVYVNLTLNVEGAPVLVTIPVEAQPLVAWAVDDAGNIIPVDYNETSITFSVYNDTTVTITYYTQSLTWKEGPYWQLTLNPQCEAFLILPDEAVPISIDPPNPEAVIIAGRLALAFQPGTINVTYMLIPGVPPTSAAGESPAPSGTTGEPGSGDTATETMVFGQGTTGGEEDIAYPEEGSSPTLTLAAIVLAALAGGGLLVLSRRSRGRPGGQEPVPVEGLDERDRMIIEALRAGPKTASELLQATGIPKTPLYRRLRRLVEEGVIEAFEEGGVRKYKLRGG